MDAYAPPVQEPQPFGKGVIERDPPEADPSRSALVKRWQTDVAGAKKHWKKDFDRMRRDQEFAAGKQWPNQTDNDDRYQANLVQRVLKTMVAALYAKNPEATIGRRKRREFTLWDGKPDSAMAALQVVQMADAATAAAAAGVQPTGPAPAAVIVDHARAVLADMQQGINKHEMMDGIGETLVCLLQYYLEESSPSFKRQMKAVVRRGRTNGVGYVKVGFQRAMQLSEDQNGKIADMAERLAVIGRLRADIADGEEDPYCATGEELRLAMAAIQSEPAMIVREGLVFSFPHSTRIIPSISTEGLMEWVGAEWVAEEVMLRPDRVKEIYGKDIGSTYTAYRVTSGTPESGNVVRAARGKEGLVCVWHVYDRATGLELVIADGYPDFLKEPASPQVFIEQFFPLFAITFNEVENEGDLFPKSDVHNMRHIQREYNRCKEGLRQHRHANRPLYLMPNGALEEEEEKSLIAHAAHDIIKINALADGQKAEEVLQPVRKVGIDPGLYETAGLFEDLSRVTGNQEAVLGSVSHGTATESNIAESSRAGTVALDGDELDDMLTALFRTCSQIMLAELSVENVQKIVGPGAIWPELSREDIMSELWLEVKAGSSGRPDQAREAANFERIYPLLVQTPGIRPSWLAARAVRIADDSTDLSEAFEEGLPSILSMNRAAQVSTGDPANDPGAQGAEGADKTRAPRPGGGDQNGFPAGPPA